jgi:hypothetical protein
MASKLSVYNGALRILGERKLASLSESRASRRRLDSVYDGDTGVLWCLQQGMWNFAMETAEITYSPSVTPAFGYSYAFDKPTDWVRTARLSDDEGFCNLLFDYEDQVNYWFANPDTIYVKYVSKATTRGLDFSLWTPNFTSFVEHHFAQSICMATTQSAEKSANLEAIVKRKLLTARATDAMDEAPKLKPAGSWSRARRGGGGGTMGDGGSSSNLIG